MTLRDRILHLFAEQKAVVGDSLDSLFRGGIVRQPRELATYKKMYDEDSTVGVSIDTKTDMVCGNGIYVTVADPKKEFGGKTGADAKAEIEGLCENIRLDENLMNINKCLDIYGYCPVERVVQRGGWPPPGGLSGILILDPPSVEYERATVGGGFKRFLQKTSGSPIPFGPEDLVWFCNNQAGNGKGAMYGLSAVKRVLRLIEIRDQVVQNIEGIMKNQARPPIIWKVKNEGDVQTLKAILKNCKDAATDPVLFPQDSIQFEVVKIDSRAAYWEYIDYIDGLIFQGLHSPMLDYLRNATEASATKMVEVIQRSVENRQRYLKRMSEHEFFEFHLGRKMPEYVKAGGEIPALHFGAPKTGLEDLKVDQFLTQGLTLGYLDQGQFFDILKQKGLTVSEPAEDPSQALPGAQLPPGKLDANPVGGAATVQKAGVKYTVTREPDANAG